MLSLNSEENSSYLKLLDNRDGISGKREKSLLCLIILIFPASFEIFNTYGFCFSGGTVM